MTSKTTNKFAPEVRERAPDNIQLVCRFVNRWKGADDDALFQRLIEALRAPG